MKQYHKLVKEILTKGSRKPASRTNMPGTIGIFGHQSIYNLLEGFPIVTTKEVNFNNIFIELLWFIRGQTHVKYLIDQGVNIWNEDAYNYYLKVALANEDKNQLYLPTDVEGYSWRLLTFDEFVKCIKTTDFETLEKNFSITNYTLGDCGKQYGWLWRKSNGTTVNDVGNSDSNYFQIDQLRTLILGLITNPFGRRHIIDTWNPSTLDSMALHPCHTLVQFNVRKLTEEEKLEICKKMRIKEGSYIPELMLDCQMYQRSADVFLGVPYNISSYALLTILLSNLLGMIPGNFIHTFGDAHIYENHISQMSMQLSREPKRLPKLKYSDGLINLFNTVNSENLKSVNTFATPEEFKADLIITILEELKLDDVMLSGYMPHPKISGKLSTGLK